MGQKSLFHQNLKFQIENKKMIWKTTLMKDNLNGRRLQWKMTSMEDDCNGRQSQMD